jgi:hypothetical protein
MRFWRRGHPIQPSIRSFIRRRWKKENDLQEHAPGSGNFLPRYNIY